MDSESLAAELMGKLLMAARFAAERHRGQRRKDRAATPYINHPIAVAEVLQRVGGVSDAAILQAALLHDTVEDTATTAEELRERFGSEVSALVLQVTDDMSLPVEERRQRQVDHAPLLSRGARQIKVADKICNLSDLTALDPAGWSRPTKMAYLDWAERVVGGCRGCNPALERAFDAVVAEKRGLGADGG